MKKIITKRLSRARELQRERLEDKYQQAKLQKEIAKQSGGTSSAFDAASYTANNNTLEI